MRATAQPLVLTTSAHRFIHAATTAGADLPPEAVAMAMLNSLAWYASQVGAESPRDIDRLHDRLVQRMSAAIVGVQHLRRSLAPERWLHSATAKFASRTREGSYDVTLVVDQILGVADGFGDHWLKGEEMLALAFATAHQVALTFAPRSDRADAEQYFLAAFVATFRAHRTQSSRPCSVRV